MIPRPVGPGVVAPGAASGAGCGQERPMPAALPPEAL